MAKTIWLKSDGLIPLNAEIAVPFSSALLHAKCKDRLDELGYPGLLLGLRDAGQELKPEMWQTDSLLNVLAERWDRSLIIKPHLHPSLEGSPRDPSWVDRMRHALDTLCQRLPFLDALFWESGLLNPSFAQHPSAADATEADLVLEEMRCVEKALGGRTSLIFYVPTDEEHARRQSRWLPVICDEAGDRTSIAFSSFRGSPWHDHLSLHPFWEILASSPDASATPLMPIVNTGMVGQGEGLWPNIPFDIFERCLSRCVRHRFEGPIALANQIPGYGGSLECSLWMGARCSEESAELLADKWLKSRRLDLDFEAWRSLMRRTREMTLEISALKTMDAKKGKHSHEFYRLQIESLLARLKFVQSNYETGPKPGALPALADYFSAFSYEARRLLAEAARALNVSIFGQTTMDEKHSFWETPEGRKILHENTFL